MSRIHEAMQKAEADQANVPANELESVRVHLQQMNAENIHSAISELPNLSVPSLGVNAAIEFSDLQKRCAHPQWDPDTHSDVFANPAFAFGAEQFRTLRSRLYQFRTNQPLRTILITSSTAGEGKTFVAGNLARAIVRQSETRVLVIDADLRCSKLHRMLGAPAAPGLSDYLQGNAEESQVIQCSHESTLFFIPAGTRVANPTELLSNGRLKTLFKRVADAFDWVIVDSPPYLALADASVLTDFCDGVLLVARAGSTIGEVAQRACRELQARKTVVGVVLNGVENISESYKLYEYQQQPQRTVEPAPHVPVVATPKSGLFRTAEEK